MQENEQNQQDIMNNEQDITDLDLEDIIREFHQDAPEPAQDGEPLPLPEEAPAQETETPPEAQDQPAETTEELPPREEPPAVPENAAATQESVAPVTGDTIRLDTICVPAAPGVAPEGAVHTDEQEQSVREDFTTAWEPEYEQPMGEYTPPEPIRFQPRSRLRELKQKLVQGPEKRYYDLLEKGVGKLQIAMFLAVLVALMCIGTTLLYAGGRVQENRLRLMVFIQFLGLLLSALLGSFQLIEGVADLFKKRVSVNTLLTVTFLLCCVDGVFCLKQQRIPCCGVFSLQVLMSLWGTYHRRVTEMGQMDTMRKAVRLDSLSACPDYYEGKVGLVRGEGQVEDLMEHYRAPSRQEKTLSVYCTVAMLAALAVGIVAGFLYGVSAGVQTGAICLLAASPATVFITLTRPYAILEKRLHRLGAVLCGWDEIRQLQGKRVFPLTSEDVYPMGSARLNGVKFFGERSTDDVVAYSAALVNMADSGLAPLFDQLLESRNGIHYMPELVENQEGGIVGRIDGELVLLGSLSFMVRMDIAVPESARVPYGVYVAIEGQFCGLFAITYDKVRDCAAGMTTLSAYRGLESVVTTRDFVLTENFIRNRFGIKTKRIFFPAPEVREELRDKKAPEDANALLLVTGRGLAPFAYGVTGARALWRANRVGLAVHMAGGILGLLTMLALVLMGAMHLLTPANVLAYQALWMIPGLLITEWTRSV